MLLRGSSFFCAMLLSSTALCTGPLMSSDMLLQLCKSDEESEQNFCQGYITGVADAGQACVPLDIKPATLSDLVINSLQSEGDTAEEPVADLIEARLKQVFPCNKKKQKNENGKSQNWSNKERIGK